MSNCALANPSGPTVVNGTASFSQPNANTLNVTNSRNAIINWQSFNIGKGQTTNFIQPGSNSAVMNRVISNNPSKIYGNLNSNGKVFLINQHGLMIGAGAQINTAGFYGSTLNITNEDFLKGNLKFEGGGFGGIQNHGYIHAGPNGNVVLVAPDIENGGVIEVENGNVILAAGESIRITSLNDAAIEFDVQSADNSVINLGNIIAKQGAARLFAGNLKHSGSINATGIVRNADGSISLVAQDKIEVSGTLTASSGKIELLADDIKIRSSAYIDVSGIEGGGEILIGGDQQGLNPAVRNATSTTIEAGAEVHADAVGHGDGGRVIVFAERDVHVHGEVTARGGNESGDGGFIETSGLEILDIVSVPDASAANGAPGEWLIDPFDITIIGGVGSQDPLDYSGPFVSTIASSTIGNTLINSSLSSGTSVSIATGAGGGQAGNILVSAPISKTGGGDASFSLRAHNDIVINADITSTSGRMDIILDADTAAGGGQIELGAVTLDANGGTIDASSDTVFVNIPAQGPIINSDMTIQTLNLLEGVLAGSGNISVSGLTTWNPVDSSGSDEAFILDGAGILFANGGFDLGSFLNNDTLTLNKSLFIGGPSSWTGDVAGGSVINGIGTITNNDVIDVQNDAQINTAVLFVNNGDIEKTASTGDLSFNILSMQPGSVLNVDSGSVTVTNPLALTAGAILEGFATFNGNVTSNGGIVNVDGNVGNIGTLTINGDLSLDANSTVVFDLCGDAACTQNDVLNVTGDVILAGNFVAFWADQFTADTGGGPVVFTLIPAAASITDNALNVFGPAGVLDSNFANGGTSFDYIMNDAAAAADIIFWGNAAGGSWNVDANWVGGLRPASNQFAVINESLDTITIVLDSVEAVAGAEIQNNLDILDGGRLLIDDSGVGGSSTITSDVLNISGTGAGDGLVTETSLLIASQATWNGGDLSGGGTITLHQLSSLGIGPGAGNLDAALIHNGVPGSSWSGAASTTGGGSILNNGLLSIDAGFSSNIPIDNTPSGTIVKSDASLTSLTGTVTAGGNFQIDAGTLDLQDPVSINGTFDVASGATLQFQGGVLSAAGIFQGSGTIDVSTVASFTSGGLIFPGGPGQIGILTFNGDVDLGGSNSVLIDIETGGGSPIPGTDYDQLVITGDADLQGFVNLLSLNGYTVTGGDTFIPITFNASSTDALSFGPVAGETVTPTYNSSDLTLVLNGGSAVFWDDGGAAGNWFDVLNWSTDALPTSADDVTINGADLIINIAAAADANTLSLAAGRTLNIISGSLTIATSAQFDGDLTLTGGTLTGDGGITVNGIFSWSGGAISGAGLLTTTNALNTLNNAGGLTLSRNWTNTGTVTWQDGNISFNNNVTLTNTGTFNANPANRSIVLASGTQFDNQGTLSVNNGTTTTISSGGTFTNSGNIDVASATIFSIATSTGIDTGSWSIDVAGAVSITGGTRTLNGGFSITSTGGSLNVAGGTLDVNTAAALTLPVGLDVNVSAGTLTGGQSLIVDGVFAWTAGAITGAGLLTTNNTSSVSSGGITLSRNWTNAATLNWQAGNLSLNNNVTLTNTGTLNANAGAGLFLNGGTAFDNQAVLAINSDSSISSGGTFTNNGAINLTASTLSIGTTAGTDTGSWTLDSTSALAITGGIRTLSAAFSITSTGGALNVAGGTLDVNTAAALTLPVGLDVNVSAGTLTGAQSLIVDGLFAWTSGAITGAGLLTTNNTSTVSTGGLTLGRNWTNVGTLNWQAGNFSLNNNVTLTNTGTLNANAGATLFLNGGTTFDNQAVLAINSDSSISSGGTFTNSSAINLTASTLSIGTTAGTDTGSWTLDSTSAVAITGGTRILSGAFSIASTGGSLNVAGGTLDVNTAAALTLPVGLDVNVSAGTLTGAQSLIVDGLFAWTSGAITGAGLLTTNNTSTVSTGGLTLSRNWTNVGILNWQAGNFSLNNSVTLINTGTLNANAGAGLFLNGGTTFDNQAVLAINSNTSISSGGTFTNGGAINLTASTLSIGTTAGSDSGSWSLDSTSAVSITGGTRTFNGGFSITSTGGSLNVAGGTLDVNTAAVLTLPVGLDVNVSAGTLTGAQAIVIDGAFNWSGGAITGTGLLTTNGSSTLNNGAGLILSRDWVNSVTATIDWQLGNFSLNNNATLSNAGVFNVNTSGTLSLSSGTTFDNQNVFSLFNNIAIATGGVFQQSAGQMNLNGASLTIPVDLLILGGNLSGSGTIVGDVINNGGTIQPGGAGAIGTITISGNLTNTAGVIEIEVQSTVSHDIIDVSILADLDDTLTLLSFGGYTVTDNDSFAPITYGTQLNGFSTINAIGGETVTPTYNANSLDIVLTLGGLFVFTGIVDNSWNDPGNWNLGVPGSGDDASIVGFDVTISGIATANTLALGAGDTLTLTTGGTLFVVNDSTLNGAFVMNGGSLDLSGMTLTLAGGFNWSGGSTIQSDGSPSFLVLPAGATVSGAGIHTLDDVTVNNNGIFQLTSAVADDFRLETGATFNNAGLFDITNDSNIFSASSGVFVNTNTIRKSGGAGTSTLNTAIAFSNTAATIDVQSGTLVLGAGPVTLDAGSVLSGIGTLGNDVVNNGGSVQPGGQDTIGMLTIAGDFTQTLGSIVIEIDSAVTTAGSDYDQLNVTGQADFGGSMSLLVIGGYTVANNDTLDPIAYATYGGTPFGSIVPIGGEIITPDYTAPDLTLTLSFAGLFTWTGLGVDDLWNNAANWDQGVPGIGNDASIPNGSGFSVDIASAAAASTLTLGADATLNLIGGTLTLANDSTLDGGVNLDTGGFDLSGSTLTLNNGLNWSNTSSIANGTLILPASAPLLISGGATNTLDNVTVNINSNTTYSAGVLTLANGAAINTNAVFDFAGDVGIAGTASSFNASNSSTIVKSAGAGTSAIAAGITSSVNGSVDVRTGNLNLNLFLLDLGAGDVFSGGGNYVGNVTNNGGAIRPGTAGTVDTLTVTGDFVSNSGALEIDISSNVLFDQLVVTNATFGGGSIDVNHLASYIPTVGLQQQAIVCGVSCAGSFGAINSPVGIVYGQTTNATNLTLDVVSVSFAWDGGGDGINWTDDLNWSLDVAPNNTIDVVLPAINVQVNAANAQANNLTINGTLAILGGDLTVNDLSVNPGANLTIAGGDLTTSGVVQIDGAFNLNSGTLDLVAGGSLMNFNNNWRGGTITGGAPLVLGVSQGDTTLTLSGAADKILDTITLDMNLNDINASGAGNLILANGATIDNTGGQSFTHSGNGDIIGTGTFINTGGLFRNLSGQTTIGPNVEFINDAASTVAVANGRLVMQDAVTSAPDLGIYSVGTNGVLEIAADRTFGDTVNGVLSSSGTVHVSGAATATMALQSGQFVTSNLVVGPAASLAGNPVTVLSGFLWDGGDLSGVASLTTAPASTMSIISPNAILPGVSSINGNVALNNPAGTSLDLNGHLLELRNNAILSGVGTVIGDVNNISGVVVAGGANNPDSLTITGNYTQGAGSALVVEVFNNGFSTQSDQLVVSGATILNGGALVIGFKTNSLGLVTSNFTPIVSGAVSGNFTRVFDAGGNILFVNFNAGVFTVVGTTPKTPDAVIDDLISFVQNSEEFAEQVASNKSEAEQVMQELLENEEGEQGSLICN